LGGISPNFDLNIMILTYKNIFYEKNGPSLLDFEGKIYQIARLLQ
jgi:hypothetical protein